MRLPAAILFIGRRWRGPGPTSGAAAVDPADRKPSIVAAWLYLASVASTLVPIDPSPGRFGPMERPSLVPM